MNLIDTAFILLCLLPAEDKPTPKLPLGKETTYVTGPLDKEGYVDYEAALNDWLGKGITLEKNANVLLWKALGPTPEGGARMPAEYFKRLGIEEPPMRGEYFIGLQAYMKEQLKLDPAAFDTISDQLSWASQRPWAPKDYPHIAAWLTANEKPLAVVVEATKRPDYFNPLIAPRSKNEPGSLLGALLSGIPMSREAARALAARALLRVGEGKFDEAWQDLLACQRLGRLIARGGTLIEGLVGIAIDQIASNAELAYLERAQLTSRQVQDRLKDLRGLPEMPPIADKIDVGERFLFLDSLQLVRRRGTGMLEGLAGGQGKKPTAEQVKELERIDWEPAFRNSNRWYDKLATAMRHKERADRQKAIDQLEKDFEALKLDAAGEATVAKLLLGMERPDKMAGKVIGDFVICVMMPATGNVQNADDRRAQVQRNVHVAFGLDGYYRDHGRYPAKLEDLAPRYLATVPDDLFSGRALIYRLTEKGYLLYSIGVNGIDDGGRASDDDPPGDDLSVRMPLPELKRKK